MPTTTNIDLFDLANVIRAAGKPVHINILARTAIKSWLKQHRSQRQYAPGAFYEKGKTIQFRDRSATTTTIQSGRNPKQGNFQIITLTFADGSHKLMAADVAGAPTTDLIEVTQEQIQERLAEDGLSWRTAVQDALVEDNRFIYFQDEQGDHWCLAELLPTVSDGEIQQAWTTIQSKANEPYAAVPTETLIATIRGLENDGSEEYQLFAFALNAALQEYHEVQYVAGAGWMLAEQWRQMEQRKSLIGPRKANIVPEATDEEEEDTTPPRVPKPSKKESEFTLDIELWRQQRLQEVSFTLGANHYYNYWLPLSSNLQRLFPPRDCQVTINHRFGDQEASFKAVVNPEQKRILGERAMYDAFYDNGIYPGAKLILSHRGSDYDYDIRTRPTEGEQSILVRHIEINDEGQIELFDIKEPLHYQVDGDVFVASARWEELPALFQQADEAGQGIFGLMFETGQEWQKKRGSPLVVTADELFNAIHYGPRMTSEATIAWELWRRLAFKPIGKRRYQFHPEKGKRTRSHGLTGRRSSAPTPRPTQRGQRAKSLTQLGKRIRLPHIDFTADDLWAALLADEKQWAELEAAVSTYKVHPFRDKMLFLRETAHQRIRQLLMAENLDELTLSDFNQQVWQLGTVTYEGHRARMDSPEIESLLKDVDMATVERAYEVGDLLLTGNQTWGSATRVYGAPLRNKTDAQKIQLLHRTLRDLIYGPDEDEHRIARIIQESNGFGINIVSGLLHAFYPERHILYNVRSVDMLTSLGIDWPNDWRQHAAAYLVYRDLIQRFRNEFDFLNLTDVDWFVYGWGSWQIDTDSEPETKTSKKPTTKPAFETTKSGQQVAIDLVPVGPLFDEVTTREEPKSPAIGYFIFQQKPVSEYDDQTGSIYNWRQGIPGSKQIQPGARFIYYRPGEQVFFGCGLIEWIELSKDAGGRTIYDGQISDYEQWKPPLPLTKSLGNRLSFIGPKRLWIGQAGIRKISFEDFEIIRKAYYLKLNRHAIVDSETVDEEKAHNEEEPVLKVDEFVKMQDLILANLKGETLFTPSGKPNTILDFTKTGLMVRSSRSESEVTWEWVQQVYDVLRELGAIERADVQKGEHRVRGGFRSAFIFGLLARFNHISAQNKPRARLVYHQPLGEILLLPVGYSPADSHHPEPDIPVIWNEEKIIARFQGIRVFRRGGRIAPHKPLLLLYSLARCQKNEPRLMPFSQIERDLMPPLRRFNPFKSATRTEDPFWRLQNDGLWEIPDAGILHIPTTATPKKDDLLRHDIAGGFPQPLYEALQADLDLNEQLVKSLLDTYFPPIQHMAVQLAVGLNPLKETLPLPLTPPSKPGLALPLRIQREPEPTRNSKQIEDR